MLPGDRLDALLVARTRGTPAEEGELRVLLDTAALFEPLAAAQPDQSYADALESRLLAHASARSAPGLSAATFSTPLAMESESAGAAPPAPTHDPAQPHMRTWRVPRLRGSRVFWQALAAAVVLTFAGGAMAVAAAAPPGSPLYGLHRWEDGVRVSLAASPADRTRLHLRYATDALVALDRAVAQRQGDSTYGDALATLRREQAAAARDLAQVPAGHERDALTTQLTSLRTQARHDLRAALGSRSWPDRLTTTSALAELADVVPSVAHAVVARESDRRWQVTLSGAGFQPGAVLLVNGLPVGAAHVVSPNLLTAEVSDVASLRHVALGVGNPDGTAAATESVATASATPTPGGGDDHGGQGSGTGTGKGGHGGDHSSTPTPTPAGSGGR